MKKYLVFLLVLFTLNFLVSCGDDGDSDGEDTVLFDDWNDPQNPNYKPEGYNPVAGSWKLAGTSEETGDIIDTFTSGFTLERHFVKTGERLDMGTYAINNIQIRINGKSYTYRVTLTRLTLWGEDTDARYNRTETD